MCKTGPETRLSTGSSGAPDSFKPAGEDKDGHVLLTGDTWELPAIHRELWLSPTLQAVIGEQGGILYD